MGYVPLLAHSNGWDEVLMFLLPGLALLWAIRAAERRARSTQDEIADDDDTAAHSAQHEGGEGE